MGRGLVLGCWSGELRPFNSLLLPRVSSSHAPPQMEGNGEWQLKGAQVPKGVIPKQGLFPVAYIQVFIYKKKKSQKLNKYATLHRAQPKPGVASGTGKERRGVRTGGGPIWGQRRVEVGCPGDLPRGLELVASESSREGILPGQVWVAGRSVKVATMGVGGRAVLRGTAAWVWGSGKRFSTPIQSGKVQMGPGQWPGSCLALRLVYTQGSRWNRGQHSPGGVLSAVLWSVAPLGASLCSDLPAGEGRGGERQFFLG